MLFWGRRGCGGQHVDVYDRTDCSVLSVGVVPLGLGVLGKSELEPRGVAGVAGRYFGSAVVCDGLLVNQSGEEFGAFVSGSDIGTVGVIGVIWGGDLRFGACYDVPIEVEEISGGEIAYPHFLGREILSVGKCGI